MLTYTGNDLWQPCELDVSDGICLPYVENSAIKIYINGAVTDLAIVDCNGDATPIPLESTNYVIAEDDKGELYTYITDIPIGEEITCFSFSVTTESGTQYTPCYTAPTCYNKRKYVYISSEFSKYDCLGRWYGEPENVIEGNPQLFFTNGFYIWGELYENATTFEFTNFKQCTVTKTNATKGYQLQALSIPPYVVKPVEAILGRGIIEVNGTQYAVQNGTHFERIIGACRSQWDMNINLTDCGCEIYHDCDLDLGVNLLPCSGSLTYQCATEELSNYYFPLANGYTIARLLTSVVLAFPGSTTTASDIYMLIDNAITQNAYVITILTSSVGWVSFYVPHITNLQVLPMPQNDQVMFDYIFNNPNNYDGCSQNWVNNDNLPPFSTWQIATGGLSPQFYALEAGLVFTATITGSSVLNTVWTSNVPFTQNGLLSITVPIPTAEESIFVSVDITPERCGTLSLSTTIDDDPTINYRFLSASASLSFNRSLSDTLTCSGGYLALGSTVVSEAWQVIPIIGGDPYSGGSPTSGTGSTFTLLNVGLTDDILISYTITDNFGNTSNQQLLFTQSGNAPDEDLIATCSYGILNSVVGTVVNIQPTGFLNNSYVPAITMNELGIDFNNDNVYEQTTDANTPSILSHDYGGLGTYIGQISLSSNAAGSYPALPFGLIRSSFTVVFY